MISGGCDAILVAIGGKRKGGKREVLNQTILQFNNIRGNKLGGLVLYRWES